MEPSTISDEEMLTTTFSVEPDETTIPTRRPVSRITTTKRTTTATKRTPSVTTSKTTINRRPTATSKKPSREPETTLQITRRPPITIPKTTAAPSTESIIQQQTNQPLLDTANSASTNSPQETKSPEVTKPVYDSTPLSTASGFITWTSVDDNTTKGKYQ